jgi:phage terminase large subunit
MMMRQITVMWYVRCVFDGLDDGSRCASLQDL